MATFSIKQEDLLESYGVCCISDQIDQGMSEYVVRFLLERELGEKKPEHVKLIVNTVGGDVSESFAIIDVMNAVSYPIRTYGLGKVYSAGLDIFINGAPGHRYLMKNTSILSHQWAGVMEGKIHEIEALRKENDMVTQRRLDHYLKNTRLSDEEIQIELMPPSDVYLSVEEALKFGLADKIVDKF